MPAGIDSKDESPTSSGSQETQPVVLIVDDNENNVKLLARLCKKAGYETLPASGAKECFEWLENREVNAVMLDIVMPNVSGIEVLKKIRETHSETSLPVIMVTGMAAKEDLVEAFEQGANDYITKPIDFSVTMARLNTQLKISQISKLEGRAQQAEALNAMIVTYNHEINNPLQVGVMALDVLKEGPQDGESLKLISQISGAFDRIDSIMEKIRKLSDGEFETETYLDNTKMARLD